MEIESRFEERENHPSPLNCPPTHSSGGGGSSSSSITRDGLGSVQIPTPPLTPNPNICSRSSEPNPYPTTFVQADTTTFKQVVQMLTGSSQTVKQASSKPNQPPSRSPSPSPSSKASCSIPPIKPSLNKKQGFKLYERRNSLKQGLFINPFIPSSSCLTNTNNSTSAGFSPLNRQPPEILSPSILDFPSLVLSPVTPLIQEPFNKSSSPSFAGNSWSPEEKAIAEKKFYLHPSPMNTPRDSEPQLLPLFPVTSPRVSGSSS